MTPAEALNQAKEEIPSLFASEMNGKRFQEDTTFDKLFKEWIDDDCVVLAVSVKEERRSVRIAVEHIHEGNKKNDHHCTYSLFRFFPTGNSWQVSVDVNEKTLEELTDRLINS